MTLSVDMLTTLVQDHGLLLLFPLSVAEGPIVSVLAGWLVKVGLLPLALTYTVLVLGDLIGDALHYALGRYGTRWLRPKWRARLGIDRATNDELIRHFDHSGGQTLVMAKLTHSLGFAALVAAGAARMPFWPFLGYNLAATLPKSAAFLALGYGLGHASGAIDVWLWRVSLGGLVIGVALLIWHLKFRREKP